MNGAQPMFRRMLRRMITTALVVLALLGAGAVAATPAHASQSDCPAYYLCFYGDKDWSSSPWIYYAATINNTTTCFNINPAFNNQTTSLVNNFTRRVTIYSGSNCTGDSTPNIYHELNCWSVTWTCTTGVRNDDLSSWRFAGVK